MSDTAIDQVLSQADIPGLDIPDALARMGNSGKLYMRIIHSFVTNMPGNLEELATNTISDETLSDYAIRIHGAKGSCYGIGANAVGDIAFTLEKAAKAGDIDFCLKENDDFIASANELIKDLQRLEAQVAAAENTDSIVLADKPDATKLAALLVATQNFDIDQMNKLVEELVSVHYAQDSDVIEKIKDRFEAFDYQTIEETIAAYL